jgi:hypothetical protein
LTAIAHDAGVVAERSFLKDVIPGADVIHRRADLVVVAVEIQRLPIRASVGMIEIVGEVGSSLL